MWMRDSAEEVILEHVGPNRDERVAISAGWHSAQMWPMFGTLVSAAGMLTVPS